MKARIYLSSTGEYLGTVEPFPADRYENACDSPEGHVQAACILDAGDLIELRLNGSETIYALAS